jgi:hypothetical protein
MRGDDFEWEIVAPHAFMDLPGSRHHLSLKRLDSAKNLILLRLYPLSHGFWGRESDRNASKNLIKRTMLFLLIVTAATVSFLVQWVWVAIRRSAIRGFRYKIFSGIPDEF